MLFLCFLCASASKYTFEPVKSTTGGIFAWNALLKELGAAFNGVQIFGYTANINLPLEQAAKNGTASLIDGKLDLEPTLQSLANALPKEINLSSMLEGGSFSFNMGSVTKPSVKFSFDNFMTQFTDTLTGGNSLMDFLIGIGMGVAGMAIILVGFFVISLIFYIIISCAFCCCCKPEEDKLSIGAAIIFYVGVACIAAVGVFSFVVIINLNNIKNTLTNIDVIIPTYMTDINTTIGQVSKTLQNYSDSVYKWASVFSTPLTEALGGLRNEVTRSIKTAHDELFGTDSIFSMFDNGGEINETIQNINSNITMLPEKLQPSKVDIYAQLLSARTQLESNVIDMDDLIDEKFNMINDKIKSLATKVTDNKDYFNVEKLLKPVYSALSDLTNDTALEFLIGSSNADMYKTIKSYVDEYWMYFIIFIVVIGVFFFALILCYAFTFHNKCCCCSGCCRSCPHCFPCCQILFLLIFGILAIVVTFVLLLVSQNISPVIDTAVDTFIDFIPERKLSVPSFSIDILSDTKSFALKTTPVDLQFSKVITIFSDIIKAKNDEGLDNIFNTSNFLHLSSFVSDIVKMAIPTQDAFKSVVSGYVGKTVEESTSFISDIQGVKEIEGIPDWGEEINKSYTELKNFTDQYDQAQNSTANILLELIAELNNTLENTLSDKFISTRNKIMKEIVDKYNTQGFPTVYESNLEAPLNNTIQNLFSSISDILSTFAKVLNDVPIRTVQNPIAVLSNLIFYDLSTLGCYASLSFHISYIGYFMIVLGIALNRKGMLKEGSRENSEEESLSDVEDRRSSAKKPSRRMESESSDYSPKRSSQKQKLRQKKKSRNFRGSKRSDDYSSYSSDSYSPPPKQNSHSRHLSRAPPPTNHANQFWLNY